jgi:hypothetical protein
VENPSCRQDVGMHPHGSGRLWGSNMHPRGTLFHCNGTVLYVHTCNIASMVWYVGKKTCACSQNSLSTYCPVRRILPATCLLPAVEQRGFGVLGLWQSQLLLQ